MEETQKLETDIRKAGLTKTGIGVGIGLADCKISCRNKAII